jgi:hypothetical protein
MEACKLGGYTVKEWRQMIEDKVVDSVSEDVLEFIKPNMFEKKNAENKKIKEEALLENSSEDMYYVRNEGYLGNALMWWAKGRNGYTCDINNAHKFTRAEAEGICKRRQDSAYRCEYIDGLEKAKQLIIDCQYVDEEERLWN